MVFIVCRLFKMEVVFVWFLVGYSGFRYVKAEDCRRLSGYLESKEGIADIGVLSMVVGDCFQVDGTVFTVQGIYVNYEYTFEARLAYQVNIKAQQHDKDCGTDMSFCDGAGDSDIWNSYQYCELRRLKFADFSCFQDSFVLRERYDLGATAWASYYRFVGNWDNIIVELSYKQNDGSVKTLNVTEFKSEVGEGIYIKVSKVFGPPIPQHVVTYKGACFVSTTNFMLKDMCHAAGFKGEKFVDKWCAHPNWSAKGRDVMGFNYTRDHVNALIGTYLLRDPKCTPAANVTSFSNVADMDSVTGTIIAAGGIVLGSRQLCSEVTDIRATTSEGVSAYKQSSSVGISGKTEGSCMISIDAGYCEILGDPSRLVSGSWSVRVEVICGNIIVGNMSNLPNLLDFGITKTIFTRIAGYIALCCVMRKNYVGAMIVALVWVFSNKIVGAYALEPLPVASVLVVTVVLPINYIEQIIEIFASCLVCWALLNLPLYRLIRSFNRSVTVAIVMCCREVCPNNTYEEWACVVSFLDGVALGYMVMLDATFGLSVVLVLSLLRERVYFSIRRWEVPMGHIPVLACERLSLVAQALQRYVPDIRSAELCGKPLSSCNSDVMHSTTRTEIFEFCGDSRWPGVEHECPQCHKINILATTHWVPLRNTAHIVGQVVLYDYCEHLLNKVSTFSSFESESSCKGQSGSIIDAGIIVSQTYDEETGKYTVHVNGRDGQTSQESAKILENRCECGNVEWTHCNAKCSCCLKPMTASIFKMGGVWNDHHDYVTKSTVNSKIPLLTLKGACAPLTASSKMSTE